MLITCIVLALSLLAIGWSVKAPDEIETILIRIVAVVCLLVAFVMAPLLIKLLILGFALSLQRLITKLMKPQQSHH
jgi:hypothetical protein